MLNISPTNINKYIDKNKYESFTSIPDTYMKRWMARWLVGFLILSILVLFLPWTQNIQADGRLTTLNPSERPQTIQATIDGRIEKWYVREGQEVKKGDTIVFLSEIKAEYFDPKFVQRSQEQVDAKASSVESYAEKIGALEDRIEMLKQNQVLKLEQLQNKVKQKILKVEADSMNILAAEQDYQIAEKQRLRTKELYEQGLKSLTDLEIKQAKSQQTRAKLTESQNKFLTTKNELINAKIELNSTRNDYAEKLAKAQSDKFSAVSARLESEEKLAKLRNQTSNYQRRMGFYYITAPQDGFVVEVFAQGIGETIKMGKPVVSIMPKSYSLACEIFIKPADLPLVGVGNDVRFIFDGWPAFFFSGWPGVSFGTFGGKIQAIDRMAGKNGKYRILVRAYSNYELPEWPTALQVGSGAKATLMLNDVPVWYEIWRTFNSFPPDFYKPQSEDKEDKKTSQKDKK